jgi:hypothetical protein
MPRTMATCHPDAPLHGKGLCRPCYIAKRKADRQAARASGIDAQGALKPAPKTTAPNTPPGPEGIKTRPAPKPSQAKGTKRRPNSTERRQRAFTAPDPTDARVIELRQATALVESIDRLPADEATRRTGDDDVQRALRIVGDAKARTQGRIADENLDGEDIADLVELAIA